MAFSKMLRRSARVWPMVGSALPDRSARLSYPTKVGAGFEPASSAALALCLALASCATTPSSVKVCPALVTYSPAQQKQAAAELRAFPAGSEVGAMIVDYGQLRAAVRACAAP